MLLFAVRPRPADGKIFRPARNFLCWVVLLAFMLASEITIDWKIFPNEYNWFHL